MAVGIYVRVSTEEQRERQSINTQREFGTRYCDLHELPVHETYADDGVSGTVPLESRPGGIRLLEDARRGRFDQLLVYKPNEPAALVLPRSHRMDSRCGAPEDLKPWETTFAAED